jgi:endo-1,4-beta-xylanase
MLQILEYPGNLDIMIPRRTFTKLLAGLPAITSLAAANETLRQAGAKKNLLVGSAVSFRQLQRPDYRKLLSDQASIVVSENDMKWQLIHPEAERYDFAHADALLAFAATADQKVRGHNLCWHNQLPGWFQSVATPENAGDVLRRHIAEVAGHYRGRIHSWDVVNEAINVDDGRPDGLRKSPWFNLLGPQYLDIAFTAASKADGQAILTYNDYDLEQDSPKHESKRAAVLQLLTSLRRRGVPVQALGLQAHLHANTKPETWSGLERFLDSVEQLGLQIFVTELDVDDSDLPGDISERDAAVAKMYGDFLKRVLARKSVKAVLTWGISDANTWLNSRHPRSDGLPKRPLPFDPEMKPTPAFYAMLDAIGNAPVRS